MNRIPNPDIEVPDEKVAIFQKHSLGEWCLLSQMQIL